MAVAYEWFQLKGFVFWIDDRLQEVVAHEGSTWTRGKRRRESFPRHLGHFFIYLVIERFDCWQSWTNSYPDSFLFLLPVYLRQEQPVPGRQHSDGGEQVESYAGKTSWEKMRGNWGWDWDWDCSLSSLPWFFPPSSTSKHLEQAISRVDFRLRSPYVRQSIVFDYNYKLYSSLVFSLTESLH